MRKEVTIQQKQKDSRTEENGQRGKQQVLLEFYKRLLSLNGNTIGFWLLTGLMETFHVIAMMVPYQEILIDKAYLTLPLVFGMLGTMSYLKPYCAVTEEGRQKSIYEKVKYLPVDRKEIQHILEKKLFFFIIKLLPVHAAVQLLFAWFAFHNICTGNFIYILFFGFLLPFLAGLPMIITGK